jgi:hypothetical protein
MENGQACGLNVIMRRRATSNRSKAGEIDYAVMKRLEFFPRTRHLQKGRLCNESVTH